MIKWQQQNKQYAKSALSNPVAIRHMWRIASKMWSLGVNPKADL
jgi:hypothetical protein